MPASGMRRTVKSNRNRNRNCSLELFILKVSLPVRQTRDVYLNLRWGVEKCAELGKTGTWDLGRAGRQCIFAHLHLNLHLHLHFHLQVHFAPGKVSRIRIWMPRRRIMPFGAGDATQPYNPAFTDDATAH
jgi:hypothetical protein